MVFLTQTLLARELGPDAYGLFASSLATVTMIAPLAGFGLTQFRLKVYGVEGWAAARWLAPSLALHHRHDARRRSRSWSAGRC